MTQKPDVEHAREAMVEFQLARRGIDDRAVLDAMRAVPRELFIPPERRDLAYIDGPVPIGWGQTISQPFVVGFMSQLLDVEPGQKVLEIGTGSGYQAAVLCELGADVYTIEVVEPLARQAGETLAAMGYAVHARYGDGYAGWPSAAPFDRIIVTAAPPELPASLVEQLAPGGRMVVPVGTDWQHLDLVTKDAEGVIETDRLLAVRFVPMVRGAQDAD